MSARADVLKTILAQDPKNTFARYGLAMEHVNQGELEAAVGEFQTILTNDPNYGAAYYHGGQALEKLDRKQDAADLYRKGMEATQRSGDAHTYSELQAALSSLG